MATLVEAMSELKLTPETSESLMVEFKVLNPGGTPFGWIRKILIAMVRNCSTCKWYISGFVAGPTTRVKAHILRQRRIGDRAVRSLAWTLSNWSWRKRWRSEMWKRWPRKSAISSRSTWDWSITADNSKIGTPWRATKVGWAVRGSRFPLWMRSKQPTCLTPKALTSDFVHENGRIRAFGMELMELQKSILSAQGWFSTHH